MILVNIGPSKESVKAIQDLVIRVIESKATDLVKVAAVNILPQIIKAEHINFHSCNFTGK